MEDMQNQPPHVVLFSSPGLGHLIPIIELGKRFLRHHNFKVTILAVTFQASNAEAEVLRSSLCDVIEIPPPDLPAGAGAALATRLCMTMRAAVPAIRAALSTMQLRPSAFIVDIFGTDSLPVAAELNIRKFVYVTSHAWFLSLLVYLSVLDEIIEGQYVDQNKPLTIPGSSPVRPEDVFDPMQDRNDMQYSECLTLGKAIPRSDGVLVNTWEELQCRDLEALRDQNLMGRVLKVPVYAVGPIMREPDSETGWDSGWVVQWLDKQPRDSVVYVLFGSGGTMSYEQMREIAFGLELSEQRFVWVVRAPTEGVTDAAYLTMGRGTSDDWDGVLPEGFVERTWEVGLVVPQWAPQVTVLRHSSVGAFLSHCGWGSTLESVMSGVPMIAWPLYAEQRMNATLLAEELGVAVRTKELPTKKVVRREEIASMVREVIQLRDGRISAVTKRVKEIKHSAEKALSPGGSSHTALAQVAKIIIGG
ncbi:anthocyanidin 3-O-glucosyltransferase 5-like [Lotus japonicus]|uniref:anthocyanidin 3-O-glucosyltransferase 5-like n=1 Tax=Lotus japonicus TaxID=34305 RepID=UPI00258499DD|nr:anthocyanidin 3-O-glucosyltransferase 5-like [Lotus japonicus]